MHEGSLCSYETGSSLSRRSLARRNAPSAGPAGRGRHCHPMDSAALAALCSALLCSAGGAASSALPKGSWRNSCQRGLPPSLRPGAASARSAPFRSAPLRSCRDSAGARPRNWRGGQPAALYLPCFILFFSPLPLRFPKRSVLGEMIHYLFLDFYKANCGPRCCHGIFFVRTL